jgi:hypothetical protein
VVVLRQSCWYDLDRVEHGFGMKKVGISRIDKMSQTTNSIRLDDVTAGKSTVLGALFRHRVVRAGY